LLVRIPQQHAKRWFVFHNSTRNAARVNAARVNADVKGNHDVAMQGDYYDRAWNVFHKEKVNAEMMRDLISSKFNYLQDSSIVIDDIHIYGTPWVNKCGEWAFSEIEAKLKTHYTKIPNNVDVLVTHGPAEGTADATIFGKRAGSSSLQVELVRKKPLVHVFGHVHEGYGVHRNGPVLALNASSCTAGYRPTNVPLVFDLKRK
jgi:Icc-related predicted phosphoesterase